jgi:ABC-type amino acid transport substrate-binding protein
MPCLDVLRVKQAAALMYTVLQNVGRTRARLAVIWLPGIVLFVVLTATACRARADTWQRIQETGALKIGLDPTYPPFEMADDGELRGLDVDLARAIADDMDVSAEFVYFGYDGLYDALATRQVDVLISALVVVPERTRDFAYSNNYYDAGQVLISLPDSGVEEPADLDGLVLAVELGAQGHVVATTWQKRLPDLTVSTYNSLDEALAAVAAGEAHAALADSVGARLFLRQQPELRMSDELVTSEPYALVVRVEDERLLAELDRSLGRLVESGQLDQIVNRWLGP